MELLATHPLSPSSSIGLLDFGSYLLLRGASRRVRASLDEVWCQRCHRSVLLEAFMQHLISAGCHRGERRHRLAQEGPSAANAADDGSDLEPAPRPSLQRHQRRCVAELFRQFLATRSVADASEERKRPSLDIDAEQGKAFWRRKAADRMRRQKSSERPTEEEYLAAHRARGGELLEARLPARPAAMPPVVQSVLGAMRGAWTDLGNVRKGLPGQETAYAVWSGPESCCSSTDRNNMDYSMSQIVGEAEWLPFYDYWQDFECFDLISGDRRDVAVGAHLDKCGPHLETYAVHPCAGAWCYHVGGLRRHVATVAAGKRRAFADGHADAEDRRPRVTAFAVDDDGPNRMHMFFGPRQGDEAGCAAEARVEALCYASESVLALIVVETIAGGREVMKLQLWRLLDDAPAGQGAHDPPSTSNPLLAELRVDSGPRGAEVQSPLVLCGQRTLVCVIAASSEHCLELPELRVWDLRRVAEVLRAGIDLEPVCGDRVRGLSCWADPSDDVLRVALATSSGRVVGLQMRPREYCRRTHWEIRTETDPDAFSDFAPDEALSESDYSEYMAQFSDSDLCGQELEIEIDVKNEIYVWRLDADYPAVFPPMDTTSWRAKQIMRDFGVERWEDLGGEFDEDEDCPLRRIVGLHIDDEKMITAMTLSRPHEQVLEMIRGRRRGRVAAGEYSPVRLSNPGEVACWRLSSDRSADSAIDTCIYSQLWRLRPFREELCSFAMSNSFMVMTGQDDDRECGEAGVRVLVWTVLPDVGGRLGLEPRGDPSGAPRRAAEEADQERLQFYPESDDDDEYDDTDEDSQP